MVRIAEDSGRGRMNCVELQESLAEVEDGSTLEQQYPSKNVSSMLRAAERIKSDRCGSLRTAGE